MTGTCELCGDEDWSAFSNPQAARSIVSDFHILEEPLAKSWCRRCGLLRRPPLGDATALFSAYELYARPPGERFERSRQESYAEWLAGQLPEPATAFEAGCGNGSLQRALQTYWPRAEIWGVEPSESAARYAREAGCDVRTMMLGARPAERRASVAFAINVVEHVEEPVGFLRNLAENSSRWVAVVCPDGDIPNSELLFADHLRSLRQRDLRVLFDSAGLSVVTQSRAPAAIGNFLLMLGEVSATGARVLPERSWDPQPALQQRREAFFRTWGELDDLLTARLSGSTDVACFGTGEAASLLRAYAPRAWSRVRQCCVDGPVGETFHGLDVVAPERLGPSVVLLGVRPRSQLAVATRLERAGHTVIRWDDAVPD